MVTCDACNGTGHRTKRIDLVALDKAHPDHAALADLQYQARQVISQAKQLKEMMPHNAGTYDAQMGVILDELDDKATRITEKAQGKLTQTTITKTYQKP